LQVERDERCVTAGLTDSVIDLFETTLCARDKHDLGAFGCEAFGDGGADAT